MTDNIDLNLLGARIDELLRLAREHADRLTVLDKRQRRLDAHIEELADEIKVQGAMLVRLEHSLERAVIRINERIQTLEDR
jgi:predicted  nucleic acid-binding Zn-ribbon protein